MDLTLEINPMNTFVTNSPSHGILLANVDTFAGQKMPEPDESRNIKRNQLCITGDVKVANAVYNPFAFREYRWFRLAHAE